MEIRLLLLDVDGVLLQYQRAQRVLYLAQALQRSTAQVQAALFDSGLETAYDAGQVSTEDYLAQLGHALDVSVDVPTWIAARRAACRPQAAVVQRLLALDDGLPLAVLTNNGPLMAQVLPELLPELHARLQPRVLCSGMLGGRKPDPAVFKRALQRLDADPGHTLFVDDLFVNVRGARAAGLHAETVRDGRGLGKVLKRYGVR
ncbi:HAD-IA family hydrolase [Stenotrophomonas sp. YAU14D1_LEIMI4_1]|uniref:HAD-IA family hydrolase n=1 Tax=Stenotrophomonas sp. YAU14D1_LEIMI4_1 TaxID=2072407 RepID=UPI000D5424E3|nr:HAD-IA family hydrolase [Stenotrophomonas sp. YAU14D1_LEIMI4_1]AWH26471.1 hydrolase [Stenotrophomonas sp. YAU14D1_LEIMI4_1]